VLTHPSNRGKGAALRTGIARALADGAAIVATLDADGQHAPAELPRLLAPLARDEADLVLGARARTAAMPRGRRCTNWLSAALASRIGGQPIADAQTGFRAFSRAVAEAARPAACGYDFETAFLLQALAQGFRVRSVPVATIYEGGPSHFRSWVDTWRVARVFARYGRRILLGAP
jgi:glycosyltransferase involved in cell wall biosynthesis